MQTKIKEAVILCGGFGTRLRSVVSDRPKPMAKIGDDCFLELLLRQLSIFGVEKVVLCTGYMSSFIEENLGNWDNKLKIIFSKEELPLGTGGALKLALKHLDSSDFYVINGDSYCDVNFLQLASTHYSNRSLVTMVVSHVKDASSFGTVELSIEDNILSFREKQKDASGFVNAGVYIFNKLALSNISTTTFSLEKELFPQLCGDDLIAMKTEQRFIDIGTPETYMQAIKELSAQ